MIENAVISDASMFGECLNMNCCFTLKGDGWAKFIVYCLTEERGILAIEKIMEVVGVDRWEDLKNKFVRVDVKDGRVCGIGNIINDNWWYRE